VVYVSDVKGKKLTFTVSGMLWNRSLVMQDVETKTLWSHILGKAMDGELKGTVLQSIPSDMVTWRAWKKAHPKTTVLDMSRTRREYRRDFYRDPNRFVLGWQVDFAPYSVSFARLLTDNVIEWSDTKGNQRFVIAFSPSSTSTRIFSRRLRDGRILSFEPAQDDMMRDRETRSVWSRMTGTAIRGPLEGTSLEQHVGIVSFRKAWRTFHPKSVDVRGLAPRRRRI
jgi:hypothetical protein